MFKLCLLAFALLTLISCGNEDDKPYSTMVQGAFTSNNEGGPFDVTAYSYKLEGVGSVFDERQMADCISDWANNTDYSLGLTVNDSYPMRMTVNITYTSGLVNSTIGATLTVSGMGIPKTALTEDAQEGMQEALCGQLRNSGIPTQSDTAISVPVVIRHN